MILKLGTYHWGIKLYRVYINNDPGLTLTFFAARSNYNLDNIELHFNIVKPGFKGDTFTVLKLQTEKQIHIL